MSCIPTIKLNNGLEIPVLGLGTWQGPVGREAEVEQAIKDAIDAGYRHIDCAHVYRNQKLIGESLQSKFRQGLQRKDIFVVSKLWNTHHRAELVEPALKQTLKDLQLDYLDLYLMHWPFGFQEGDVLFPFYPNTDLSIPSDIDFTETWKAMEELYKKGLVKAIGIANFNSQQIAKLLKIAKVVPVINQIECHPYLNQTKLRKFCKIRGIAITAYSPLGSPERPWQKPGDPDLINDPRLKELGQKYKKTPAQILIRYNIQLGNVTIPKSSNKTHIQDNFDVFGFELSNEDMDYLNSFDCNGRICPSDESRQHPLYPFKEGIEF